jgi:hypothetical protein
MAIDFIRYRGRIYVDAQDLANWLEVSKLEVEKHKQVRQDRKDAVRIFVSPLIEWLRKIYV